MINLKKELNKKTESYRNVIEVFAKFQKNGILYFSQEDVRKELGTIKNLGGAWSHATKPFKGKEPLIIQDSFQSWRINPKIDWEKIREYFKERQTRGR